MASTLHNIVRALPAALLAVIAPIAFGAVGSGEPQVAGVQLRPSRTLDDSADVHVLFVQEDGPAAGHVRVELTPETRPLNGFEARSAAQQAFLAALDEPGLGDGLSRITVVVRLAPAEKTGVAVPEQRFLFTNRGGRDWSVSAGW
jgi:hypothetical protein